MKKYFIGAIVALIISIPFYTHADDTQTLLNVWKRVSGYLTPTVSTNGVKVPSLASTGTPCVTVDSTGVFATSTCGGAGGSGTVTSVALTVPTGLTVAGSPVTASGTLAISLGAGYVIPLQSTLDTFATYSYSSSTFVSYPYASSTFPSFGYASSTFLTGVTADSPLSGNGTAASHLIFTNPGYILNSYASSTFVTYGYGTSTYATIALYPTYAYASSTFPSFSYGTSTYATIASYPTYTYASATFATLLNTPSYSYASATFPSFSYASSTFQTALTTGNLTASSPLQFDNTRQVIGGAAVVSVASGYNIPLTASTTNWNTFYDTPSNRITAGTNLSWSGNTINGTMASSTIIAGGTATHSPSITFATSTDTNLGLRIVCATATCTYTPQWIGTLAASRLTGTDIATVGTITSGTWNAGIIGVAYGGTGTSSAPSITGQILAADGTGTKYAPTTLVAGSNITLTTTTPGQITIAASLAGGSLTGTGVIGKVAKWNTTSDLNTGTLFDNGTVAGMNATSSTIAFNIQGTAGVFDPFNVASSSGTSYLRVIQGGNVGIGTTTPGRTLTVVGDMRATGILYDSSNAAGSNTNMLMSTATGYSWISTATLASNLLMTKNFYTVGSSSADFITTGTNDHTPINNAINAATATCGIVHLKAGTYNLGSSSSNYILLKPCVTLEGEGANNAESASSTLIVGGNVEYSNNSTSVGPITTSAPGSGAGVSTGTTTNSNITVRNLSIKTQKGYNLTLFNGTNLNIQGIEAYSATTTLIKAGIYVRFAQNVNVDKNYVHDSDGNGININGVTYFQVTDNVVRNTYDDGIDIDYDYGDTNTIHSKYGTVNGNQVKGIQTGGSGNAIRVENSDYVTVINNQVDGYDPNGIWVGNDSRKGGDVTTNISIIGNMVSNNIVAGIQTENVSSVTSSVSHIDIFNNTLYNNGTNAGTNMRGGIVIYASTTVGSWQTVRGNSIDKVAKTDDSGGIVVRANNVIVEGNSVNDAPYAYHLWNGSGTVTYTNVFFRNNFAASTTAEYYNENNALTQAGVTTQVYTNAGRFGIATTTGASTFTVQGTGLFSGNLTLAGITGSTQCLHVDSNGVISGAGGDCALSGGVPGKVARWTSATTLSTGILFDNSSVVGINASSSTITLNVQGTAGAFDPFNVASSSGTSYLRVLQGGNVGIGQSNPAQKLQVTAGNISIDNAQQVYFNGSADTNWRFGRNTGSTGDFTHLINTSASLNAIISSNSNEGFSVGASGGSSVFEVSGAGTGYFSGNVGIGTSTPAAKLSVVGTAGNNTIFNIATSTGASVLSVTPGLQVLVAANARFTVPQGTAPTLSAAGDIAVDTDNGGMLSFYSSGGRENLYGTTTIQFVQKEPSASDDYKVNAWNGKDVPLTITKVICRIAGTGNTPSYTFSLPHGTSLGTASANAMTSGQACTSTTTAQSITIAGDLTLAANEAIWATSSAMSNASTVYITIFFKHDN